MTPENDMLNYLQSDIRKLLDLVRKMENFDAALLAAAFAAPILVGGLNVMNSIAPHTGSVHSAVMEVSPIMHAMIFYVVVAIVLVKGAAAFVARVKASQKTSK